MSALIRILGAPARYLHKMHLLSNIMGYEIDLDLARRQAVPMPELEKILLDEIAHARAEIDRAGRGAKPAGPVHG